MEEKIKEINKVLNKIRPYIQRDGGDIVFPMKTVLSALKCWAPVAIVECRMIRSKTVWKQF